jgi:hypothetical protein
MIISVAVLLILLKINCTRILLPLNLYNILLLYSWHVCYPLVAIPLFVPQLLYINILHYLGKCFV